MSEDLVWIDAGGGYALALDGGKLVCRNPKGARLASVPASVKDGEVAEQLKGLVDWLAMHAQECSAAVETWMLRSLPVPREVLDAVWADASWRASLENAVVVPVDRDGAWSPETAGFLRAADPDRGLGLVNLDGETVWIDAPLAAIPHPILLADLGDFRELATELGISQGVAQLFRETWPKPADLSTAAASLDAYSGARFEQLNHALGRARSLGYRVRGGWATCPVWEDGRMVEARYWIGSEYPESEAYTGELSWVDAKERALKLVDIGPVAFSEGNRMAGLIHAGRAIPKDGEQPEPEAAPAIAAPASTAPTPAPLGAADVLAAGGLALAGAAVPEKLPVDRVVARSYRHTALPGRVVARLTAEVLAPGEDRVMDFLGFDAPDARPALALQRRRALGFPGWALVNDPDRASFALEVVKEFKKHARRAASKPGFAKEGFDAIGERLGRSVPHFLPPFYEEAGRAFLDAGSPTYAAQAFNKAREAERVHALPIDEDQRRQAFVDFALAGALTVKAISAYAKDLEKSYSPEVAYRHFRELCVRRTLGGLPPWAGMAKELRALAKASKLDAEAEDAALLGELLEAPALSRAPAEFWTAYRKQIVRLARTSPEIRGVLLNLMPGSDLDTAFHGAWIELLDECGALDALTGLAGSGPAPAAAAGGPAGWLSREIAHVVGRRWSSRKAPEQLFGLVRRMKDRLAADGAPVTFDTPKWNGSTADVDLVDLALELGVPVAEPGPKTELALEAWITTERTAERPRDPVHVAADPRFEPLLARAVGSVISRDDFKVAARGLRGLAAARAAWYDARLEALRSGPLPAFESNLAHLATALSPEVCAEFPDLVPRLGEIDTAGALARTARAGLLDELGWPPLEAAVDELRAGGSKQISVTGVFPYVVVTDGHRAIAVGAAGRLLDHELRMPAKSSVMRARYAGGQLLVVFRDPGYQPRAYWSGSPDEHFDLRWYTHEVVLEEYRAAETPDGGVTEGGRAIRAGDTDVDATGNGVVSDGETFWRYDWTDQRGLRELDPDTGESGRWSMPAFFEEFAAPGMKVAVGLSSLGPLPEGLEGTPLGARDGLAGWRVRTRIDDGASAESGSPAECEGVDGRRWQGQLADATLPAALVSFPGDDRPRPLSFSYRSVALWEPDGQFVLARAATHEREPAYARGTPVVLPVHCWHFLTPRDEAGSRALRGLTDEIAARLLEAAREDRAAGGRAEGGRAAGGDAKTALPRTHAAVETLLPEITHPRLRAGLAGLAAVAAGADGSLAKAVAEQDRTGTGAVAVDRMPVDVDEQNLLVALEPLAGTIGYSYGAQKAQIARQAFETGRFFAAAADAAPRATVPVAMTVVRWDAFAAKMGAAAFLAVSDPMPDAQRDALLGFLELWSELPFAGTSDRLRMWTGVYNETKPETDDDDDDENEQLEQWLESANGNRYLVRTGRYWHNGRHGIRLWALEYAPGGEFTPLRGTTLEASEPFGASWGAGGRARAFVAEARARGPVAWDPAVGDELARRTGLTSAAAALLWLGCPGFGNYGDNFLPKELRAKLGLKVAEAVAARKEVRAALGAGSGVPSWLPAVFDAAMQGEPDAIWSPLGSGPGDDASPVARFADAWIARVGRRVPVPAALVVSATKDLAGARVEATIALAAAAEPARSGRFRNDAEWVVSKTQRLAVRESLAEVAAAGGDEDEDIDDAGESPQPREYFDATALSVAAHYVPYLFMALPAGDPLRANLPELLDLVRERLAAPSLLLSLASFNFHDADETKFAAKLEDFTSAFGGGPYAHPGVPADQLPEARDTGELVVAWHAQSKNWGNVWVSFRPSLARDFAALSKLAASADATYSYGTDVAVKHCELALSAGYTAIADRIRSTPVPDGEWEANPLHAVPELVAEVGGALGVSEAAAALYLQTLALAEPTTKSVQEWNRWTPARYKAAAAELAAAGLLLEAKRERAGRSHFLPGGWLPLRSPDLPIETWKLPLYGVGDKKSGYAKPLSRILPLRPLHELFAEAWARVARGDKPEYEEV